MHVVCAASGSVPAGQTTHFKPSPIALNGQPPQNLDESLNEQDWPAGQGVSSHVVADTLISLYAGTNAVSVLPSNVTLRRLNDLEPRLCTTGPWPASLPAKWVSVISTCCTFLASIGSAPTILIAPPLPCRSSKSVNDQNKPPESQQHV